MSASFPPRLQVASDEQTLPSLLLWLSMSLAAALVPRHDAALGTGWRHFAKTDGAWSVIDRCKARVGVAGEVSGRADQVC